MGRNIMALLALGVATALLSSPVCTMPRVPTPVRASFYASKFEGRKTADGSRFRNRGLTAASLKYPLGSVLKLRSLTTGKEVRVRVTDRGPWSTRYSLDLSGEAFKRLGKSPRAGWDWVVVTRLR